MTGTTVYVTYSASGIIEKVHLIDRNGVEHDLTEMMFISGIGWSYDASGGLSKVTFTIDSNLETKKG